MKNKLEDLRNHLFETLESLKDPDNQIETEIARANAVSQVAQVIIATAKVEIQFLDTIGATSTTDFFDAKTLQPRSERARLGAPEIAG